MIFVDRVEIYVKGGDGGRGGNVILRAVPGSDSLAELSFRRHWVAQRGQHGMGKDCTGKAAEDIVISVPPGTIVRDRERGFVIKDLSEPNSEIIVARCGKGGKGNARFASATNQAPRDFEPGQPGEERWIILELKSIADVGLVGLPNAGKSTLLSRLSKAHPEIADYPFTTKHPNLGICRLSEDRTCVIADIPGLIEGAHAGIGLGHEFLRHVERTRVLVHLVESMPLDGSTPIENYRTIRKELELYSPKLVSKSEIVVLTKCELLEDIDRARRDFEAELGGPVLPISSVTGQGLRELCLRMMTALDTAMCDACSES